VHEDDDREVLRAPGQIEVEAVAHLVGVGTVSVDDVALDRDRELVGGGRFDGTADLQIGDAAAERGQERDDREETGNAVAHRRDLLVRAP
jgi:hypothetical protein